MEKMGENGKKKKMGKKKALIFIMLLQGTQPRQEKIMLLWPCPCPLAHWWQRWHFATLERTKNIPLFHM